jgi:hypothetical protein
MGEIVDSSKNEMVDWLTGVADPPAVAARYLALFNGDPQGAGSEVTGTITGGATRPDLTAAMAAASAGAAANDTAVTVTTDADAGATVTHWAIMDDEDVGEGNVLASDALVGGDQVVSAGNTFEFAIGDITVSITG